MLIAPSILNENNLALKTGITKAVNAGITRFHIDIMDGHFVPNLSFGPELITDFKREFPMIDAEIHLMSDNPKVLIPEFVNAGADIVELHYEAMSESQLNYWFDYLLSNNIKAVLAINPDTDISVINKFATKIQQLLIMTVKPGFGGQSFIEDSVSKISQASKILADINPKVQIEVDGGINTRTLLLAKQAGASIFVVGSYIYNHGNIVQQIDKLNEKLK